MDKKILIWQLIVLILGLILILTIREFLLDRNEILAETARANCYIELKKLGEESFAVCQDIKDYKIKVQW